jgi:hypothetical protein
MSVGRLRPALIVRPARTLHATIASPLATTALLAALEGVYMRPTREALAALAALLVLVAVAVGGCGGPTAQPAPSATAPPSTPADITGTIHDLSTDSGRTVLLVVDDGAMKGTLDRASVSVTADTVIWLLKGGRGTAADLGAGQMVSVWFDGPVAESYPVQGTAGTIEIQLED